MSDPNLTEPDEDDAKVIGIPQKDLKALRERGRRADEAEARAIAAERELAFSRARIDPETPGFTYFVKGYEGDLTPEAIRAAAVEARLVEAEAPSTPAMDPAEAAAHQRIDASAAGAHSRAPNAEAERDAKLKELVASMPRNPSPHQSRELERQMADLGVRFVAT